MCRINFPWSLCLNPLKWHITFYLTVRGLGVTLDSELTLSQHVNPIARSFNYQLRQLRVVSRSLSLSRCGCGPCSRLRYYCNSLLIGLPKVRLSPLQSVLKAAARLIARLPRYSHISAFMFEQLHWLPLSARIKFKILILVFKAQRGLAPKYLADVLLRPLSASSHRPLRSSNRLDLLVPHTRTAMAQSRSFNSIGPSLWNALSPSTRSRILASNLSSTFAFLKTFFFSCGLAHWERL